MHSRCTCMHRVEEEKRHAQTNRRGKEDTKNIKGVGHTADEREKDTQPMKGGQHKNMQQIKRTGHTVDKKRHGIHIAHKK